MPALPTPDAAIDLAPDQGAGVIGARRVRAAAVRMRFLISDTPDA